ncbi:MAG: alpha/beta fold hydrolase [Planctomycetes bacterium]|nr:alpha/beta fold hydrolase [Planctomycetota bacterium]
MVTTETFRIELGDGHFVVGDERRGAGPCYVFLHGLASVRAGEKSTSLLTHAAAAGRGFVRFDLRGHGESSGRIGRVAVSELIADTIAVLERTGPAWLVGSSLGGLVGAYAAAARPDLVRRLALLAPAFGLMPRLRERLDPQGRLWTSQGDGFHVEERVIADALALDERGLPARLSVPTLLVHGTADETIPPVVSQHFFAAMQTPHKQLWLVPDGDHRLNTAAAEIWQRLDHFPVDARGA